MSDPFAPEPPHIPPGAPPPEIPADGQPSEIGEPIIPFQDPPPHPSPDPSDDRPYDAAARRRLDEAFGPGSGVAETDARARRSRSGPDRRPAPAWPSIAWPGALSGIVSAASGP
jgi:hypothetical protein